MTVIDNAQASLGEFAFEDQVLSRVVGHWAETDTDRVCISQPGGIELTYGDLEVRASAIAHGLHELGIQAGDRVLTLLADNGLRTVYLPVALAKLGAIEVPANPALVGPSLGHMIEDVEPAAVVVDRTLMPGLVDSLPPGVTPMIVDAADTEGGGDPVDADLTLAATVAQLIDGGGEFDAGVTPSDTAAIMYTSGTTGPPKGAIMPHRHVLGFGQRTAEMLALTAEDTMLTVLPLFHAGGRGMNLIACLSTGSRCALIPRFSASEFWQQAVELEVTTFHVILSAGHFLLAQEPSSFERDHSIERGIVGPATDEIARAFDERYGVRLVSGYASTEANVALINRDGPVSAMGRPSPPYRAWVVDDQDQPVPAGEVGELVIASDEPWTTFRGYWNRPATTVDEMRNFAFHTGDAARLDDDGYLWFVDRIKDMIRRRGENISAMQVETAVNEVEGVIESAAYAVPSDYGEEEVAVAVTVKPDADLDAQAIVDGCRDKLPRFALPRFVRIVEEIPKTQTGKVQKTALREAGAADAVEVLDERKA